VLLRVTRWPVETTGELSTVRPSGTALDDDLTCGDDRLSGAMRREVVVGCVDEPE
jgi:hypothetical protein